MGRLSSSTTGAPRNDPTMVIGRERLAPPPGSGPRAIRDVTLNSLSARNEFTMAGRPGRSGRCR